MVEALAYLGGTVILVALVLATVGYWPELSRPVRIAIPLAATTVLLLAGALVPAALGMIASRLRGVLWMLSSATLSVLLAVLTDVPSLTGPRAFLITAGGLVMVSVVLWLVHRATPQHVATFVAAELLAVAIANEFVHQGGAPEGGSLAVVALAWGVAAWFGLLPGVRGRQGLAERRTSQTRGPGGGRQRLIGMALAAMGASVGGVILAAQQDFPWLGAIPMVLVVSAAIAMADLIVLGIGAAGTLVILPLVVHSYVESVLSTALVLLVTGAALVAVAVWVARRRRRP